MAKYFAEIKEDKVLRVIVCDTKKWCEDNLGGEWVETFMDSDKNYAGIGHSYDKVKKNFIAKKPYVSWILDDKDRWKAPIDRPNDDKKYEWNEDTTNWIEFKQEEKVL